MKAWIFPTIVEFMGILGGLLLIIPAYEMLDVTRDFSMAVMAIGLSVMIGMRVFADDFRMGHIKRILKKNGLWQDDEIRKKDIPK